jgi:hypothetical protein
VARSFEKIDYAFRPAKIIERKMMCEVFSRLARVSPLSTYKYIGFGAIGFYDFGLLHRSLGINDMLSIESCEDSKKRFEFNKPYSCIEMGWGKSHKVLPRLKWTKRAIVWLDYEDPLNLDSLDAISTVCAGARSGSLLVVTVRADSALDGEAEDKLVAKRLEQLKSRVGARSVPDTVKPKDLAGWGLAKVCRQIIYNRVTETLFNRNGGVANASKLKFVQTFNFHYADGTRMLTVGGLFLNPRDEKRLGWSDLKDLSFVRNGDDAYLIETPILTRREIHFLNEVLPKAAPKVATPRWLPAEERKKYGRVYRYFPSFSEIESH